MRHIQNAIARLLGETDTAMKNKLAAKAPAGKLAGPDPAAEGGVGGKGIKPDANALRAKGDNEGVAVVSDPAETAKNPVHPSAGGPASPDQSPEEIKKALGAVRPGMEEDEPEPDEDDGLMDADGKRDDPVANMLKRLGSKPVGEGSKSVSLPPKSQGMTQMPRPKKGGHKLPKMGE